MAIRVMAKEIGHYGHLREPGNVFLIKDEKAFSKRWMTKVDGQNRPIDAEEEEHHEPQVGAEANTDLAKKKPKGKGKKAQTKKSEPEVEGDGEADVEESGDEGESEVI